MSRTERLKAFCVGRFKRHVAEQVLGVRPQLLSFLLQVDIDELVERIDALPVDEAASAAPIAPAA